MELIETRDKKLKYLVKVSYNKFLFDERDEAMDYADTAKLHGEDIDVTITLLKEVPDEQ